MTPTWLLWTYEWMTVGLGAALILWAWAWLIDRLITKALWRLRIFGRFCLYFAHRDQFNRVAEEMARRNWEHARLVKLDGVNVDPSTPTASHQEPS